MNSAPFFTFFQGRDTNIIFWTISNGLLLHWSTDEKLPFFFIYIVSFISLKRLINLKTLISFLCRWLFRHLFRSSHRRCSVKKDVLRNWETVRDLRNFLSSEIHVMSILAGVMYHVKVEQITVPWFLQTPKSDNHTKRF